MEKSRKNCSKAVLGSIILAVMTLLLFTGVSSAHLPAGAQPQKEYELPILMYHGLLKEKARQGKYIVSPDQFEEDLRYLRDKGYETVVVQDLIDYVERGTPLPPKPVMITFDDGYYNNYYYAYPLLEKYDAKIVISPICRYSDEYSEQEDAHPNYSHITWENIREMEDSGRVEIQNHSYDMHGSGTGGRLGAGRMTGETQLEYETAFIEDLTRAQERIQEMTGRAPDCFVYPFGIVSDGTLALLKKMGFRASMICEDHANKITRDPDCLFMLGRYLRPGLQSSEAFFEKIGL